MARQFSGSPSSREQLLLFAKNFLLHPKMLGSLIPSSRFLVGRLLRHVDWDQARVIVEYGPGVGNFTREILRQMRPDAILIALETNSEFITYLRNSFSDPRLRLVHTSAAEIQNVLTEQGMSAADYVIGGIPLSILGNHERERILLNTRRAIQPDGAFLVYQFSPKVLPDLKRIFSCVTRSFELLNFLPAQVFCCAP